MDSLTIVHQRAKCILNHQLGNPAIFYCSKQSKIPPHSQTRWGKKVLKGLKTRNEQNASGDDLLTATVSATVSGQVHLHTESVFFQLDILLPVLR